MHRQLQHCFSVIKLCLTLCNPMHWSTPGFPVLHYLPEFAQTRIHWFGDAIQPSHPLSSPSPPALNLSQHRGLFQWPWIFSSGGQSIGASTSVLPMNIQGWFPSGLTSLISLLSKGLLRVFSRTTVQKHQFFVSQPSLWSNSYIPIWLLEKPQIWPYGPLSANWCLCFLICCLGFVTVFLPRRSLSKEIFNFMAAVTICSDFGAQENKVCHCFQFFPIYLPWNDGTRHTILVFWLLSFKPTFSLSSEDCTIRVVLSKYLRLLIFFLPI